MSSDSPEVASRAGRPDAEGLALFHRTLAELCRAEVPLPHAFRVLQADLDRGPVRDAVAALAADVEGGVPLAAAYARRRDVFPPTYRALVEAGTASGDLPGVLDEIAAHAEHQGEVQARIRRALAPTVLSAVVVLLVGSTALAFAMPRLWTLAAETSGASPLPWLLGGLGLVVLFLAVVGVVTVRRGPAQGSLAFRVPVLGPIRRDAMRATVLSTLALLLRRRLPLPSALRMAAATAADPRARGSLEEAGAKAEQGASLGDALRSTSLLDPAVGWLVATGEGGGEADLALEDAARLYRRRLDRRLDRVTLLLRPAADLTLGVAVFAIAFSYLVPLLQGSLGLLGMR